MMSLPSWIMVLAYMSLALLTARLASRQKSVRAGFPSITWFGLTIVLFSMAMMRHFHLHEQINTYMRNQAFQMGWYQMRRPFQSAALAAIFMTAGSVTGYWMYLQRELQSIPMVTFLSAGILSLLWVVRTISFHYTDMFIHIDFGLISVSSMIELIGLFLIFWATREAIPKHK